MLTVRRPISVLPARPSARLTHRWLLAALAAVAPTLAGADPINPIANGRGVIEIPMRTQGYGIDDGHVLTATVNERETSALQWALWRSDRMATIVTVIGLERAQATQPLYSALRGFPTNAATFGGPNTLRLAGRTYAPSQVALLTRSEIAARHPELELGRLQPEHAEDQYAYVRWDGVLYANGARLHAGYARSLPNRYVDLFVAPFRFTETYRTLSVDCNCPADEHRLQVRPDLEVVATHHQLPTGTGLHNRVLNVIGLAGPDPFDRWQGMRGFAPDQVFSLGEATFTDAAGRQHTSTTRLLPKSEIQAQYPEMDVSHLSDFGLYAVDYWAQVQLLSNMRGNSVSRISADLLIDGQRQLLQALTVESGAAALGSLSLSGSLLTGTEGQALTPPAWLEWWWPIVIHPTGLIIDADVGVLTRVGDSAQATFLLLPTSGGPGGLLTERVVLTGLEPRTLEVSFTGRLQSGPEPALPLVKRNAVFSALRGGRLVGRETLDDGVERGTLVIALGSWRGTATLALPARFRGQATIDGYDPASGTFTGAIERGN